MFDRALTRLIRMLMWAGLRQILRLVKTPAGFFSAVMMGLAVAMGILPSVMIALGGHEPSPSGISTIFINAMPTLMYLATTMLLITDSGRTLLELRPAELQFVLAGPFTNAHILSYRLVTLALSWIPVSALFTFFLITHFGTLAGAFLGIALGGALITLISFQYTLLAPRVAPRVLQGVRLGVLVGATVIVGEVSYFAMTAEQGFSLSTVQDVADQSRMTNGLTLIFRPFATLMTAGPGAELFGNAAIATALVAVCLISCYVTNSGFAELAVEGVARRRERLDRIRGGNQYGWSVKRKERTRRMPSFPWAGGVGPVAWSQVLMVSRRSGNLIPGILAIGLVAALAGGMVLRVAPALVPSAARDLAMPVAAGFAGYLSLLITLSSQSGFAANARVLSWYRVLPIHPMAVSIGMVIGTSSLLVAIQCALYFPASVITSMSWVSSLAIFYAGFALSIAIATASNFVSAASRLRIASTRAPDVFQGARAMIFIMVLGITLTPTLLFAAGAAAIAGVAFGFGWVPCCLAAGTTVLAIQPIFWWYAGQRFVNSESFDE